MEHDYMNGLNETETKVVEALCDKGDRSFQQIADEIGISVRHLHRIRSKREVKEAVRCRTIDEMGEEIPNIMRVLVAKAKKGDYKSIELFVKMQGMLVERQEVTTKTDRDEYDGMSDADLDAEMKRIEDEMKKYNAPSQGKGVVWGSEFNGVN